MDVYPADTRLLQNSWYDYRVGLTHQPAIRIEVRHAPVTPAWILGNELERCTREVMALLEGWEPGR